MLSKSGGCGRFTLQQLNKTYQEVPLYKNKFSRIVFGSFLLTPFFINNLFSKNFEKIKITIETKVKNRLILDQNIANNLVDSLKFSRRIIDKENIGISGVSIMIKSTTLNFVSNANGLFTIPKYISNSLKPNTILIISTIGYKTKEIVFSEKIENSKVLEEDYQVLNEQIIIGGYCSIHRSFFQRAIHKLKVGF